MSLANWGSIYLCRVKFMNFTHVRIVVKGAIHKHSIDKFVNLKLPKSNIKTLTKNIHQNAINYFTYLVLNKRKFGNKQTSPPPPLNEFG